VFAVTTENPDQSPSKPSQWGVTRALYKIVAGLAFVISVMTATGVYSMSIGLGTQGAILVIGMGWVTVLLIILGLLGRTAGHSRHNSNAKEAKPPA
jgi:uncharacterized membrane protein